jgi:adenine-specific DNA-methyltransferase
MLDKYFRISSGNTQVSATEIRAMPLPSIDIINEIGHNLNLLNNVPDRSQIDEIISRIISKREYITKFVAGVSDG